MSNCECSEEYGPCEDHCTLLVMRDGASSRTADDVARCFIDDALELGVELSATGRCNLTDIDADWDGSGWLDDPELSEALYHLSDQIENDLATVDHADGQIWTYREDGYRIVAVHPNSPLFQN